MKLLIKKLWFPHSIDSTMTALFRIPQMREQFDEGFVYDGEIRPRGIKIHPCYWPADAILDRLPDLEKDVYLVLTSMDLKGKYGGIYGHGHNRKAIASSHGFTNGYNVFHPDNPHFSALAFGEIGHALGLEHHDFDPLNPCEMSHNHIIPGPHWSSLEDIRFCNDCYRKIK
jgi:predicted Zn-dependent protease